MSLHPHAPAPIPEETARVARAAFPASTPYIRMRDQLDVIYQDADVAHLFPARGKPAASPWRLALVTIFQFAEHLSDRQAADAVRVRIDWKHALSLELTDSGFDHTVLSEFRSRLLMGGAEQLLLDVSWSGSENWACSKHAGVSARTPPMCSRLSAPSTGWSWCEKRCATPSMSWPMSPLSGCGPMRGSSGSSDTGIGAMLSDSRRVRRHNASLRTTSAAMVLRC
jgi:transposase